MSDVVDTANDIAETNVRVAIQNRPTERILYPKGTCYNCEAKVKSPKLYCDVDCRDDHQRLVKAKQRNGRI